MKLYRSASRISLAIIVGALAACGGGGGGGGDGPTPVPVPVASTATFPFFSINAARFNEAKTRSFTVSLVMDSSQTVSGTGTDSSSAPFSGTFEGQSSLVKNFATTITFTDGDINVPVFETSTAYYDSNYYLLGGTGSNYYTVVTQKYTYPQYSKIGDTGPLGVATVYSDSSKSKILGSSKASYVFEPDSDTTAIMKLISMSYDASGNSVGTTTTAFRVSTTGNYTVLTKTTFYVSGVVRLETLTYQ